MSNIKLDSSDTEYSASRISGIVADMEAVQQEIKSVKYVLSSNSFDTGSFSGSIMTDLTSVGSKATSQHELISKYSSVMSEVSETLGDAENKDANGACISLPEGIILSVTTGIASTWNSIVSWWNGLWKKKKSKSGKTTKTVDREEIDSSGTYEEIWKSQNTHSTDVPLYGQHKSYTCGAANASMILASMGINVSEEEIWAYANSNNQGTYVYRVTAALNHFSGDANSYSYKQVNSADDLYNTCASSIDAGYPVEIPIKMPKGNEYFGWGNGTGRDASGHYITVTGVYKNLDGKAYAMVNDSYSEAGVNHPQQVVVPIEVLKEYSGYHSGYVIYHNT